MLSINISAFAISSQYWEENPLQMEAGETKTIEILLQNMAGTEDIMVEGTIIESSEIARIIDTNNEYLIKSGDKTYATIEISIPKDNPMTEYNVILSFKTSEEGVGTFGLGNSIEREIPITVSAKPKIINETSKTWIIAILVAAVITITILFIKKNKKKK